jgi:hypothetical protein
MVFSLSGVGLTKPKRLRKGFRTLGRNDTLVDLSLVVCLLAVATQFNYRWKIR